MKKIAKLSLVAAVAVLGFTSANAQSLEEAIKGVDVSGTAAYRYDDRSTDNDTGTGFSNTSNNSYKIAVNLKSAVNDDLTFNTRTIVGKDMVVLNTAGADANADVSVSHVNFAYTGLANTTVIAGKQAVPSPFAVQSDAAGDEDTGTGITAITNLGAVTVAGTYLNQTNLATGGADLAGLGLMGNVGPVALDGWYLDIAEVTGGDNGHQAYTVGAKAAIEMVKLSARYSAIAHDGMNVDTESLLKVGASAKIGIVSASLDYGQTNDVTATTTGMGITGDSDADVSLQAWALNLNKIDDASLVKATLGVDLLSNLNLSATYADLSVDSAPNKDASEYYGQLTYKMGKNFMTYARIGQVEYDLAAGALSKDNTRGRLHVQYTF